MHWELIISLIAILSGAFVFKKLWLGLLVAIIAILIRKMIPDSSNTDVVFAFIDGCLITIELGLLLFGAYLFYNTLSSNNHFESLTKSSSELTSKLSVVIVLCFLWGALWKELQALEFRPC